MVSVVRMVLVVVLVGFVFVGVPFVLGGVVIARQGLDGLRRRRAFQAAPRRAVASLQTGDLVTVAGTARADRETISAAFTGATAVAADYEVREWTSLGDGSYQTIHEDQRTVPFRLDDGEDAVLVDAPGDCLDISGRHTETVTVDAGEELPDGVRRYVERTPDLDAGDGVDVGPVTVGQERRHYGERTIRPGDPVVVFGRVERDPDADWGDSLVVRPTNDEAGLLTDYSVEDISIRGLTSVVGHLLLGGLLCLGPFGVLGLMLVEILTS